MQAAIEVRLIEQVVVTTSAVVDSNKVILRMTDAGWMLLSRKGGSCRFQRDAANTDIRATASEVNELMAD